MNFRSNSLMAVAVASLAAAGLSQSAYAAPDFILADDFADADRSNNAAATIGAWDTATGISAPSTSLTFLVGGTTNTAGFHNKPANDGMIDVNNNMTAGGWDTEITIAVGDADIVLDELVLDMRLTNGAGAGQTTGSKSGQMLVDFLNASDVSIGSADLGGNVGYPTVDYTRTLDLTGITLLANQTYTMVVQARGTGYGHHKALDALSLTGEITIIPEPASGAMALVGLGVMAMRRRRG